MEEYSEEELQKKYENLPLRLREALFNPEVSERISKIGERFGIPGEKMEELARISGMVFMGVLPLSSLAKELKEKLDTSEEISQRLARDLESEVFSKYKDELEKIYPSPLAKGERVYKPEELKLPAEPEKVSSEEKREIPPAPKEEKKIVEVPRRDRSPIQRAKRKKLEQMEKSEEAKRREELLKKRGPDQYREPIGEKEIKPKREIARIVKEEGRIRKIF